MIRARLWHAADALVHILGRPAILSWICDRYEAKLLGSAPDFYEDDEPLAAVRAAFDAGEKRITVRPIGLGCQHVSMTAGGLTRITSLATSWCDCEMRPIYPTSAL